MLSKLLVLARWLYFAFSEIIGFGGWRDDYNAWIRWLKPMEPFFESWLVRAFLIISGGIVLTYPQWSARALSVARNFNPTRSPRSDAAVEPQHEKYKREAGRLKLKAYGRSSQPLGISIAARFVDPSDVEFADRISDLFFFGEEDQDDPYEIEPVTNIEWFENRSSKSRVVIYSDVSIDNWRMGVRVHEIVDAINEYNLLGEPVDLLDRSKAEGLQLPDFDAVIVVFPRTAIRASRLNK